ncbi:vacuolar ATPase assembly integral membrane protein vma21-like [Babylonia areolata]|uniref:vacuolar ATPase assembly integral membrane protein vma21-like n=1 Tax=Babylonia areolata TaxID=304850 RepID=UPI003FCF2BDD
MARADGAVMKKMLFFTVLMALLPILSYFFSKAVVFEGMMGMGSSSYFYAAIVAIVIVHIILGCFIYVAFTEDDTPRPEFKKD